MDSQTLRVLIVEDSEDDARLLTEHLSRANFELEVNVVETAEAFSEALSHAHWDLVISDYNLPRFSAPEALELLRNSGRDLPFIVVSGTISEDLAVRAMRAGAHDYVMKDNLARLVPAILRELEEVEVRKQHRLVEDAYQTLVENSLQGLVVLQNDHIVFSNHATTDMLGYEMSEMIAAEPGRHWRLIHPEDRDTLRDLTAAILADGGSLRSEVRLLHRDGESRWIEISATRTTVRNRHALQIALADVTQRKRRERELQTLAALSAAARGTRTRRQFARAFLSELLNQLQVGAAALSVPAKVGSEFVVDDASGLWADRVGALGNPVFQHTNTHVSTHGKALYCEPSELEHHLPSELQSEQLSHLAVLPLVMEDESLGQLWVGFGTDISTDDRHVLQAVSKLAATALYRTALQDELKLRLQRLNALRAIDLAITSSRDLGLVFDVMLEQIRTELGIDAVRVYKRPSDADHLELVAEQGRDRHGDGDGRIALGQGLVGRVARDQRMQIATSAASDSAGPDQEDLTRAGFVTQVGLPLLAGPELRGVLEILSRDHLVFDAEGRGFLESVAWQAAIAIDGAMLFEALTESNQELSAAYESTLEGWARALELRDQETEGHTRRVTDLTVRLASRLGINGDKLDNLRRGAILHDIGKMAIPDHILLKPGPLDDGEWEIMRKHTEYAVRIISPIKHLRPALEIPASHHERWNGQGYPEGLAGEEIPIAARIFSVVDVWDALRSDRPYRAAVSEPEVREYLLEQSGVQFDPRMVTEFLAMIDEEAARAH